VTQFFDSTQLSGDQELGAYSEAFGCAVLVTSTDPQAFPVIHGQGPVGFEVEHCLSVDGACYGAGYFELIRSWLPADWLQRRGFPAIGAHLQDRNRNALAEAWREEKSPKGAVASAFDCAASDMGQGKAREACGFDPEDMWKDYEPKEECPAPDSPVPERYRGQPLPKRRSALTTSWLYRAQKKQEAEEAMESWLRGFETGDAGDNFEALWEEFRTADKQAEPNPGITALPKEKDGILILRNPWLGLILSGIKTLEIRGMRLKPRTMWLGSKGLIFGQARIQSVCEIKTDEMWRQLYPQHRWDRDSRPYRRTFALQLTDVRRLSRPQRYTHPSGAIGIVKYRKPKAATTAPEARSKRRVSQKAVPRKKAARRI